MQIDHLATDITYPNRYEYRTSSPLCQAAANGYYDVVLTLMEHGANATLGE